MKHIFLILVALTMTCKTIDTCFTCPDVIRCENDEVICYWFRGYYKGGVSCKWKELK